MMKLLMLPILLLFLIVACQEREKRPPVATPVEFTLGGYGEDVHFRIPKYYFEYTPTSDPVKKFMLEVRLPGFVPEKLASYGEEPIGVHDRARAAVFFKNNLHMTISAGLNYTAKKIQESSILPDVLKERMTFEEKYGLYYLGQKPIDEHGRLGIKYNKLPSGEIKKSGSRGDEFYVPKESFGKEGMYIGCGILVYPQRMCRMYKDIGPSSRVVIRFSYSRIVDWRDLNQQITDFITSFIIPNREIQEKGN